MIVSLIHTNRWYYLLLNNQIGLYKIINGIMYIPPTTDEYCEFKNEITNIETVLEKESTPLETNRITNKLIHVNTTVYNDYTIVTSVDNDGLLVSKKYKNNLGSCVNELIEKSEMIQNLFKGEKE